MVIGNGFFCDTMADAIQEMGLIAHSDVVLVPLPVTGCKAQEKCSSNSTMMTI